MKSSESSKAAQNALGAFRVDPDEGTLTAFNERFLLIPVKLIHSIEDRLVQSFGPITATLFEYEIGKQGGAQYLNIATRAGLKVTSPGDVRRMAQRLGTLNGWGRVEVVDFDFTKKFARVRWTNGVSVRNMNGKTPVCHFGRGILTGATEAMFRRPCESLEVSCQGKGDKFCEAIIGDSKVIAGLAEKPKR